MTELERIEIKGFKGLESLEFEPSQINLITGRNNTGKTSLLEAIEMLSDPNSIRRFSQNFKSIINVNAEKAAIAGDISGESKVLELRRPSNREVQNIFTNTISDYLLYGDTVFAAFLELVDEVDDNLLDSLERDITQILTNNAHDGDFERVKEDFLIVDYNSDRYTFFNPQAGSSNFLLKAEDELLDHLFNELIGSDGRNQALPFDDELNDRDFKFRKLAKNDLSRLASSNSDFFFEEIEENEPVLFIQSATLANLDNDSGNDEKDAIKIDNIGDYLRNSGLANNLKTFDIDYLVFENEDGEKYQIPYDFMGDGFKAVVGLLWELMDDETANDIVLIEEPENHMHPGYVRKVVRFLIDLAREEDVQLFITTHDNDFINDFFMENLTDEQREFLEEEFTLIQMEQDAAQVMDYETAEQTLKDLHLDLRGL